MIPDFPTTIRIRLAKLNFFLLRPDVAKFLPCWLSQFRKAKLRQPTGQRLSNVRTQQTKISIGPIFFSYYEESLVSSNLNSKQLSFQGPHPIIFIPLLLSDFSWNIESLLEQYDIFCISGLSKFGGNFPTFHPVIFDYSFYSLFSTRKFPQRYSATALYWETWW